MLQGIKKTLALLSVLFLLHALVPGATFVFGLIDGDASAMAQDIDPIAEEEDEHNDAKLKFLPPHTGALLPVLIVLFAKKDDNALSGFVEEIPTPPPLL